MPKFLVKLRQVIVSSVVIEAPTTMALQVYLDDREDDEMFDDEVLLDADTSFTQTDMAPSIVLDAAGDEVNTSPDLIQPLTDFDLSVRLQNVLDNNHIDTVGDLCGFTRQDFAALRHVGRSLLTEADALVEKHGWLWRAK